MEPFYKIKNIRVTKESTFYTIELTCPRCNHFESQIKEIKTPDVLVLSETKWITAHGCNADRINKNDKSKIYEKANEHLTGKNRNSKI